MYFGIYRTGNVQEKFHFGFQGNKNRVEHKPE
jgi:hypothetical protein